MGPLIMQIWARSGFNEIKEFLGCRNEMGRGLAQRPVIVGVSQDLRGDSWGYVPRSLFWQEGLDGDGERGFDCLTFALVSSKAHHEGCRGSREDPIRASKGRPSNRRGGYAINCIAHAFKYDANKDLIVALCASFIAHAICDLDNSTNNVLIPLDSWTSGLLVYKLPLSAEYGVSTSIGYSISNSLSNTAYSFKLINTAYPLPLDTAYRSSGTETEILKKLREVMIEPILSDYMEKTPIESNLSITINNINIELSKEFLVELRKNMYHRTYNEDVVDHIAKVLKMVDLIYVPGADSHQLRMKIFPLSLADDAKEWWISKGDRKITTWEELIETFFCRFYPESYDGEDEMLNEGENWGIDPLEFLSNVNTSLKNHLESRWKYSKGDISLIDEWK
ncbi:hypothetical protein Tco_0742063 [Tanacetum coccineum]